jgi:hypothetical protein
LPSEESEYKSTDGCGMLICLQQKSPPPPLIYLNCQLRL